MNNRSILFLTNAYPDFESSYRGIFIRKMALLLQREGYEICVVTPKIYKKSAAVEEHHGIKVYRFPFFSGEKLLIEHQKIPYLKMMCYLISGCLYAIYVILKHHSRVIHVHWAIPTGSIGILTGAILKKPVIATIHGSDFRLAIGKSSLIRKVFRYVCRNASHVHCVSEVMKNEIEQIGVKREKISIFPMGVDEAFFEAGRKRQKKLKGYPLLIISNRNLLPIYNVILLLRAIPIVLRENPEVRFLIAGDGPERKNLEREAKLLDVSSSVEFLGRISPEEMPSLLAEADIYVSTSFHDGTSVSLLEAMASGLFPVVSDIPSNREWIKNGENGFLIPTDGEEVLARKVVEAVENQSLLILAAEENRKIASRRARWKDQVERITEIYEGLSH